MKRSLLLIMFLFALSTGFAQGLWLSYPDAAGGSQVWFRRAFVSSKMEKAWLNVTTTGRVKIYVNGMNVTTSVFEPFRKTDNAEPIAVNIDVSDFIRPDTNVIALWYSPLNNQPVKPQISACFYGFNSYGQHFSYASDGSWLCRKAPVEINDNGGENIDGTKNMTEWKNDDCDLALWQPSEESGDGTYFPMQQTADGSENYKMAHVRHPKFFDVQGDSTIYDFGTGFVGRVRVTLRGARKGEVINIGPMQYVCNGKIDEQACPKFMINSCRRVIIYGDKYFRREQINKIEGIEIYPLKTLPY